MAKQGNIRFGVEFQSQGTGLADIKRQLQEIVGLANTQINVTNSDKTKQELGEIATQAKQLEAIFSKSFNFKLNSVDFTKFQANLKESNFNLANFTSNISKLGVEGPAVYRNLTNSLIQNNKELKQSSKLIDKMADTLANTIRWSIASTAINSVTSSIQKAWSFTKQLDSSLNDIMIVTGKSANEMEKFAIKANNAAKALGTSTKSYTDASLIYYQQGLSDQEVAARSETTVKVANVTGQSAQTVSEQLTAVWNGYKVSAQESEAYIDKLSAVAAKTAADLEELSVGMSRVASAANIMGVDIDQLNAQLATIVSVTREAPESIGTALKTVYARMSDIEAGLDSETTLGEYTTQMAEMGINVLDAKGNLRDMGEVVEEIGSKWNTLNREQQVSLAQSIAGTRQYSRMMALFDNWDMYEQAKSTSQHSIGTLQKQQDTYMKSTEAHIEKLGAAAEDLYDSLFDQETMNKLIDGLTKLVETFDNLIDAIGGGGNALLMFSSIATKALSNKIGDGIGGFINNKVIARKNKKEAQEQEKTFDDLKSAGRFKTTDELLEDLDVKEGGNIEALEEKIAEGILEGEELSKATQAVKDYQKQKDKLLDPKYAKRYNEEVRLQAEYQKDLLYYAQNKSKMSEDEIKQWQERLGKEANGLNKLKTINEQDYQARLDLLNKKEEEEEKYQNILRDLQKQEEEATAAHSKELLRIEREKQEELARIREAQANDKEVKAAEKEVIKAEEESQQIEKEATEAIDIFRRQTGEKGETSEEVMIARLQQRDTELKIQESQTKGVAASVKDLSSEDLANEELSVEIVALIDEEVESLQAQAEQLQISNERMEEYIRLRGEFKAAMEEGDTDAAQSAGLKITDMASADLSKGRKETQKATKTLEEVDNKRQSSSNRKEKAKERKEQVDAKAQEKRKEKEAKAEAEAAEAVVEANKKKREEEEKTQKLREEANKKHKKQTKEFIDQEEERAEAVENAANEIVSDVEEINQTNIDDKTKQSYENFGKGLADAASGAQQLAAGIMALKNIGNIWNDEDATVGEKILQTFMALATGLPMVILGITGLSKGIKAIKKDGLSAIPALFGFSTGAGAAGGAATGATPGVKGFGAALKSAIWPVTLITIAIAALVAIIAGLINLFSNNDSEKAAEDAKKAAEHANEMAEAYNNVKQEYEDLKASIEDYKNAQKAIDEMTAGTEEWRDAIADSNSQVMELIKKYPELAKYMTNEGGRLQISEEGLEAVEAAQKAEVNAAERMSLLAQQRSSEANLRAQRVAAHESIEGMDSGEGALVGYAIAGPLGAAIGAIAAADALSEDDTQDLADILAKNPDAFASQEAFEEALKGSHFEDMAEELWDNRQALEELTQATIENNAQQAALRQQIALSMLQETATYQGLMEEYGKIKEEKDTLKREEFDSAKEYYARKSELKSEMDSKQREMDLLAGFESSEWAERKRREQVEAQLVKETGEEDGWEDWSDETKSQLVKEYYAKLYGISESDVRLNEDEDGESFSITYTDKDGKVQTMEDDSIDWADFEKNLVDQRIAATKLDNSVLEAQLKKFNDTFTSDSMKNAFATFSGDGEGDFSALTQTEKDSLSKFKDFKIDPFKLLKQDPEYMAQFNELQAMAEALGVESVDILLQGIQNGLSNYEKEQSEIRNLLDISQLELDADSQAIFNNFNQQTQKMWAQKLHDATLISDEAGQQVLKFFNTIAEENMDMVNMALEDTDWTNEASIKAFTDSVAELSEFQGAEGAAAIEDFTFQMKYLNNAIEAFDVNKAVDKFNSLQEVLNSVASDSRSIDADQYESLSTEMRKYFLRMADGTYSLIGAADEFRIAAKQAQKEAQLKRLDELAKKTEADYTNATTLSAADKATIVKNNQDKAASLRSKIQNIYGGQNMSYETLGFDDSKDKNGSDVVPADSFNMSQALEALALIKEYYPNSGLDIDAYIKKVQNGQLTYDELDRLMPAYNTAKVNATQAAIDLDDPDKISKEEIAVKEKEMSEGKSLKLTADMEGQIAQMLAEAGSKENTLALMETLTAKYSNFQGAADFIQTEGQKYVSKFEQDAINFTIETDPFEVLNNALDKSNRALDKFAKLQSLAYGKDAINLLTQYNGELQNQARILDQKLSLQEQEIDKAQNNLLTTDFVASDRVVSLQEMVGNNFVQYDSDGYISNWNDVVAKATEWIKRNYDATEAENFASLLEENKDDYDSLISDFIATQEERKSKMIEVLNNNLERFELSLQLSLDFTEAKQAYNKFLQDLSEESDFKSISNLLVSNFNIIQDNIATYYDALDRLSNLKIIDDKTFEKLKEATDNMISASDYEKQRQEILNALMEEGVNLKETLASIDENIIASQEAVNEAYDKYVEYIESENSALEHQASLYELMYGDRAFTKMQNYYAQMSNSASLIANARASQYTADLAEYEAMLANRDQYSKEQIESITSQYMSSADMYMQALNDRAAAYQEQYLNTVQVLLDEFDQTISQGKGTEKLKEEWDWIHSTSEDYLNNMEASFALSSLEASFTKAIDNSASINAQKKLNDLREQELKKLREKDKLTQYDIDRANKRLEIAQAEIALQEAQANKSKMRLTRGADGTYSYQYVADQDAIAEKTEQLNKLQQDLVSLDEDKLKSSLDTAYDLYSEWMAKVQELVESGATEEEILEMTTKYTERIAGLGQEVQSIFGNLEASFEGANTLLDTNFDISETLPWLDSGWMAAFKEATYQGFDTLFEGTLERILTAKDDYDNKIEEIDSQLNDESGVIAQYLKFFEGEDGLLAIQQREIDAAEEVASNLMNLVPVLEEFRTVMQDLNAGIAAESFLDPYLADNVSERGGEGSLQWVKFKDTEGMKELAGRLVEQFGDELNTDIYRHMLGDMRDNDSMYVYNYERLKEFLKAHNLESLATGGYTGEWDDSGRLAVLHQKELVLNQDDTRNILAAVDLVRNLETALSASMYDKILSEAQSMFTRELFDLDQVSDIEQNVYINAEFPNAEDKDEIREAFQEIIALAQQRVLENNRK